MNATKVFLIRVTALQQISRGYTAHAGGGVFALSLLGGRVDPSVSRRVRVRRHPGEGTYILRVATAAAWESVYGGDECAAESPHHARQRFLF